MPSKWSLDVQYSPIFEFEAVSGLGEQGYRMEIQPFETGWF